MADQGDLRGQIEAVARGYATPHLCGRHGAGLMKCPCICLSADESLRLLESALKAALDLCDADVTTDRRAYQLGWDIRQAITRELEKGVNRG